MTGPFGAGNGMCGIFGLVWHESESTPDRGRLQETVRLLQHRGPDDGGFLAEPGIGLVHTRLSLLDLNERSNQPFWDRRQRFCLIYNGEIYNFQDLRSELEKEGVSFRTTSDTEVVLEALLKWGFDVALPKLDGMFAFALYDRQERSLSLARDRFGIKPLFLCDTAASLMFASDVRAFQPWMRLEPDVLSISSFLQNFAGPTKGFTFFKHVRFLDPGSLLKVTKGQPPSYRRFASLADFIDPHERERLERAGPAAIIDEFESALDHGVRSQLVADAPVGALCSGGVDSSTVLALAARHHRDLAIFHADVVGPLSERDAAETLARHLKLELKAVPVSDIDFIEKIPDVLSHYGFPFYATPHSVPFMRVAELIRDNRVKAVLSGEGADECFLGYDSLTPDWRQHVRPRALLRRLRHARRPPSDNGGFRYFGLEYVGGTQLSLHAGLSTSLHNRFEIFEEALEARRRAHNTAINEEHARSSLESIDLLHYNLRSLLHRNDTMGMAASIESRFPYLDHRLVKLAINLPRVHKIRFSTCWWKNTNGPFINKWVLREVGRRLLPPELSRRRKLPFPVNAYSEQRLRINKSFLRRSYVQELFGLSNGAAELLFENAQHDFRWRLVLLEAWAQLFLLRTSSEEVTKRLRSSLSVQPFPGHVALRPLPDSTAE
jgi:asparagine synthase (glutamine-hydrolysing)